MQKGCGLQHFAKNMNKNIGKNISKNLISKQIARYVPTLDANGAVTDFPVDNSNGVFLNLKKKRPGQKGNYGIEDAEKNGNSDGTIN